MGKQAKTQSHEESKPKEKQQDVKKEDIPKQAEKQHKEEKPSKSKAKASAEASPESMLAKLRPQRRSIFFILWLAAAAWILFIYSPCNIPAKKRKDCGYMHISSSECRTFACFLKDGGSAYKKKTVKVKRKQGMTLGLDVDVAGSAVVRGISDDNSAVKEYNDALTDDSDDVIAVGDRISKIDGKSKSGLEKVLKATEAKTVSVDILRPSLPAYLMWVSSADPSKPNFAEKMLTAPGVKQWTVAFSHFGGVSMFCWLLSGYPAASLPIYYLGVSGLLAFNTMRCCHDDQVGAGVAHCYKPRHTDFTGEIVPKILEDSVAYVAKIRKDPRAWFKKTFGA
jgi:hypothetical protein